jgi:transglutaminase-like putative cysteine protease
VPSISVRRLVDAVREMSAGREAGDQVGRGLGLEPRAQPGPVPILAARRGGDLPRRHLVGAGPELAEHAAMVVQVESAPLPPGEPYYWRSLTYDQYTGRGWSAGPTVLVDYEAGEPALLAQPSARQLVRQNVRLARDAARLVFVTGSLLTVDRDFEVAWRTPPEADVAGDAFGGAMQAQSYRADSLVPVFGADDLRAAGQSYPRWVLERYLNIPEEVPDRVLALARDLTATEPTPYDRALALERYLRQIPYTLDLPAPPLDRDLVDYFLFDLRRGYCDYYASAMVILARAAGLPARLVTGYATGTYDARNDHYVVTEAQAHSWVDIYFPGYGWVEFEPTAGLPALDRAAAAVPPVPPEQQSPSEPITAQRARLGWRLGLGIGLGLLGLVVVDGLRLRRLSSRAAALELYRRLVRISRWLGLRPRSSDTPYEFAASFAQGVQHLAQARRMQGLLRSVPADVHGLASLCTRALYSFHALPAREHQQALGAWGRLRWRLWAAGMIQRLPLVG